MIESLVSFAWAASRVAGEAARVRSRALDAENDLDIRDKGNAGADRRSFWRSRPRTRLCLDRVTNINI